MSKLNGDLVGELDQLLNLLIHRVTRDVLSMVKGKVTPSQFAIMRILKITGRLTVTGVADDLQITPSGVTSLIDRMVEVGLVERVRDDDDRRIVWIGLTAKGRETSLKLDALKRRMVETYVDGLQDAEVRHLIAILSKILHS